MQLQDGDYRSDAVPICANVCATEVDVIVRQMQEKLGHRHDQTIPFAFVDLGKAFDHVPGNVLRWTLGTLGVREWVVHIIQGMYLNALGRVCVPFNGQYSEQFDICVSVQWDSVLSPLVLMAYTLGSLSPSLKHKRLTWNVKDLVWPWIRLKSWSLPMAVMATRNRGSTPKLSAVKSETTPWNAHSANVDPQGVWRHHWSLSDFWPGKVTSTSRVGSSLGQSMTD